MRTLNFRYRKFRVGNKIVITKDYVNGSVIIRKGEIGTIESVSITHLPDMGLFDLRILHIKFKNDKELNIGDQIASDIMDTL